MKKILQLWQLLKNLRYYFGLRAVAFHILFVVHGFQPWTPRKIQKSLLSFRTNYLNFLRNCQLFALVLCLICLCGGCESSSYQGTKALRVGIDPSWYTLASMGQEKNVTGFIEELFLNISQKSGVEFELMKTSPETLLSGLISNKYDGIISNLYPYNFYQDKYLFSNPFLLTGPVLVTPITANYKNLNEMESKIVGIANTDIAIFLFQKHPKVLIYTYDSIPVMLDDVVQNKIDGAVLSNLIAFAHLRDLYSGKLKMSAPLVDEGLRLITIKERKGVLVDIFEKNIKKLEKNGTLSKLKNKWYLPNH